MPDKSIADDMTAKGQGWAISGGVPGKVREALECLEWDRIDRVYGGACSKCGGYAPESDFARHLEGGFIEHGFIGHAPGCLIGEALTELRGGR